MSRTRLWVWAVVVCLFSAATVCAQTQPASDVSSGPANLAAVPRLIKYSGRVVDARGEPVMNVAVRLTFAVYEEQQGGAAIWAEAQMVQLDEQGHYSVLLGATRADGLPVELFPAGKTRWLGVAVEGRDEDPRVLLVSVPYALKAEDAAMLGGRSAADFVLGEQLKEEVRTQVQAQTPGIATQAVEMLVNNPPNMPAIAEGPSTFTCATTGDCVNVTQSGTGRALRTTATSTTEAILIQQNGTGYGLRALVPGNVALVGQITGSAGTSYGVKGQTTSTTGAGVFGYNLATTGLSYGVLGQTQSTEGTAFFGRATSTTGATIGLRGHADSTSGTGIMGQATATSGTTTGILGRVFSAAGTALIVDNTQGGKLLSGKVGSLEKFKVDGSGNVYANTYLDLAGNPIGSGSSNDLNCVACVSEPEVSFNYAGSSSKGGAATSAVTASTATNALSLGGIGAVNFARLDIGNSFVGDQSVTGKLTATGSTTEQNSAILHVTQNGHSSTDWSQGNYHPAAIRGDSTAISGYAAGVLGTAQTNDAAGVIGINVDGIGVGGAAFENGIGVAGFSYDNSGAGVVGICEETTTECSGLMSILRESQSKLMVGLVGAEGSEVMKFSVDGSGNVRANAYLDLSGNPIPASVAQDLNCTGCVSPPELSFNYAGSSSQGGAATSALSADAATTAVSATNALNLGGVVAANFARLDVGNNFNGMQRIYSGGLTVPDTTGPLDNGGVYIRNSIGVTYPFIHNCCGFGAANLFAGIDAGRTPLVYGDITSVANVGVGREALYSLANPGGIYNTAIGYKALRPTSTGDYNTGLGALTGGMNVTGTYNTFVGYKADASSINLTNATAIGAFASVGASNSLVLGSINGVNSATATVNVGIGTTTPLQRLEVNGGVRLNTTDSQPTCDADARGMFWVTQGATDVADTVEVCTKDAANAYAWRTVI